MSISNSNNLSLLIRIRSLIGIVVVFVNLSCVCHVSATPVAAATMIFLQIHPSPEANGRSGVLFQTGSDDPLGVISNPALLGFSAQKNIVALGFYPTKTEWLPSFDLDLPYSAKAYNLGLSGTLLSKWLKRDVPISLGVGFNEILLDLGEVERRDDQNNYLGTFHVIEKCRGLSLGLGIDYMVKAGFGINFKHADSDLGQYRATVDLVDWGYVLKLPLHKAIPLLTGKEPDFGNGLQFELSPAFSYAKRNISDKVSYIPNSEGDPTPRMANVDISLLAAVTRREANFDDWTIFSIETGTRGESGLFYRDNSGGSGYRNETLGDISIWRDLILGKTNDQIEKSKAWEVDLLETVAFRSGRYEDHAGKVFSKSFGFGLRTTGHFKQLRRSRAFDEGAMGFITRHLEMHYSYSSYDAGNDHPLTGTKFHQISLYYR